MGSRFNSQTPERGNLKMAKIEEHCTKTTCMFYPEGDNCWYWKHKKELCKMPAEIAKLTQPVWDKDFDEGKE